MLHRVHLDFATREREGERRRHARSLDRRPCTLLPAGPRSVFSASSAVRPRADLPSISTMRSPDEMPACSAGVAVQRGDDGDPAVAHVHLDADAGVVAARALVEPAESALVEEDGVRIVQLSDHARHRLSVQQRVGERVDVVAAHVRQHLVEQARARRSRRVARAPRPRARSASRPTPVRSTAPPPQLLLVIASHSRAECSAASAIAAFNVQMPRGDGKVPGHRRRECLPHAPGHVPLASRSLDRDDRTALRMRSLPLGPREGVERSRHALVERLPLALHAVVRRRPLRRPGQPLGHGKGQQEREVGTRPPVAKRFAARTSCSGNPRPPIW